MERGLKAPPSLDFTVPNLAHAWQNWKEEFELYLDLAFTKEEEKQKVKLLYYLIGEKGREICKTLGFSTTSTLQQLVEGLDDYCTPKQNETMERYQFFMRQQGSEERLDAYVTALRTLATTCNFGAIADSLIRDRIVCGATDQHLRERLLREPDLTLTRCLEIARAAEATKERLRTLEGTHEVQVHAVQHQSSPYNEQGQQPQRRLPKIQCMFCGKQHEKRKERCPAYGQKCKGCGKPNHFQSQCKSEKKPNRLTVRTIQNESDESENCEDVLSLTLGPVNHDVHIVGNTGKKATYPTALFATMLLNKHPVRFQLDCGATCNVLPLALIDRKTDLEPCGQLLIMYNSSTLRPVGKCRLKIRNPKNNRLYRLEFIIVEGNAHRPLLGSKAVQAMQLIHVQHKNILNAVEASEQNQSRIWTMEKILKDFGDVFEGEGHLAGKLKLEVDPSVEPVKIPKRRVPMALAEPLKKELASLQSKGIIAPVETSTEWISSLVIVRKPSGKLRICIDPKPLNKALKRSHYPLPTIDDVLCDLSRAKVFSVFDVKNGFWHIELDKESSYLTTFATPFGRYRWLRMPMGISPAPEVFQRRLNQELENIPGLKIIADDILIVGEGDTIIEATRDHDKKLCHFLERCRERNIKLNQDKARLRLKEVPYIGHLLTADGLKVDPGKVKAIREMPRPEDVKGVQRFLGMVNYLAKFCKGLAADCEPLRQLTHKEVEWEWSESHQQAFHKIKDTISKTPVLKYYSPGEQLVLQCDASQKGLGAALLQKQQPIAFASRALSETERGYAQIEKELLAVLFGMERFHQLTFGQTVHVQSDHKPLETIVRKPLLSAPKRLQRMLMRLQKYDVQIQYHPGKNLVMADTLSRAYLSEPSEDGSVEKDIESINMLQYLPISRPRLQAIQEGTEQDTNLQIVKRIVLDGWPETKHQLPVEATPYFSMREELSVQDGILFRANRAIIPEAMRLDIMKRIHSSHMGIESCLRRARECVYWPGMNDQLKTYMAQCEICNSLGDRQQKETLHPHEIPRRPWEKVGVDLFKLQDKDYLITVDYYSNFWEIDSLLDTRSRTIIRKLKGHFARYGIPDVLFSDNGPQFVSEEFRAFRVQWEFDHQTSSPAYPQSNGKAESAVKTAKRILVKAKKAGTDPYLAVLDHRNTPSQGLDGSPAQSLMGRRTKTLLPMRGNLLQPEIHNRRADSIAEQKSRQAHYYNKSAKDLPDLHSGDQVWIQPAGQENKEWRKAEVQRQVNTRSFEVVTPEGQVFRRNRRHLRRSSQLVSNAGVQNHNQEQQFQEERAPTAQSGLQARGHSESPARETGEIVEMSSHPRDTHDTTYHSRETTSPIAKQVRTRAGRLVQKPHHLQDYV